MQVILINLFYVRYTSGIFIIMAVFPANYYRKYVIIVDNTSYTNDNVVWREYS